MPNRQTDLFTDGLADVLADDVIRQMTELGLGEHEQRRVVVGVMVKHTHQKLQQLPRQYRELFVLLLTEAVLGHDDA